MTIAYSYIRFSTKKQELGHSLARQVQRAREYAAQHNLELDDRSFQDLGISALKGENAQTGALGAFLKAVDDKIIPRGTFLLVEALDRITRQDTDVAAELFLSIVRRGITIVTLMDNRTYSSEQIKRDRGLSLMAAIMYMAQANEESAKKSDRIKKNWDAKAATGLPMTVTGPSWLKRAGDQWKPVPKKVAIVEKIFNLAGRGHGALMITNELNSGKTPTPTLGEHKNKADAWSVGLVSAMLKNRAVIGELNRARAKQPSIPGYYGEGIIPKEQFDAVQVMIKNRTAKKGERTQYGGPQGKSISNLFTGLLKCECGKSMKFVSGAKPHLYLQCADSYSKKPSCDGRKIPYQKVEAAVLEWLLVIEDHDFEKPSVLSDPRIIIRAKLEEVQGELDNRHKMIGKLKSDDAIDRVVREIDEFSVRKRELERELRDGVPATPIVDRLGSAVKLLKEHTSLKDGHDIEKLRNVRERLRTGIRGLVNELVCVREVLHTKYQDGHVDHFGYVLMKGDIVDQSNDGSAPSLYRDGGILLEYKFSAWSFFEKQTPRQRKLSTNNAAS